MDRTARARFCQRRSQECRLLVVAFNEMNPPVADLRKKYGGDNARKSPAASEVQPSLRARKQLKDLCAVSNMALPDFSQRRRRHQIDRQLPISGKVQQTCSAVLKFHVKHAGRSTSVTGLAIIAPPKIAFDSVSCECALESAKSPTASCHRPSPPEPSSVAMHASACS